VKGRILAGWAQKCPEPCSWISAPSKHNILDIIKVLNIPTLFNMVTTSWGACSWGENNNNIINNEEAFLHTMVQQNTYFNVDH
jgi:hypothetical protein